MKTNFFLIAFCLANLFLFTSCLPYNYDRISSQRQCYSVVGSVVALLSFFILTQPLGEK